MTAKILEFKKLENTIYIVTIDHDNGCRAILGVFDNKNVLHQFRETIPEEYHHLLVVTEMEVNKNYWSKSFLENKLAKFLERK